MEKKDKTFPLRVSQSWLDEVEQYRIKNESKHQFVLNAVGNEIKKRKAGYETTGEDK